ncbi:hypothetical protein ACWOGY_004239 [Vibrio vulnificus]|nr:hypothetical protein [Vibrio vulnificus]EJB5271675.1 hypothetical protein [Vibrio vulnificus]
MEEGMEIAVLIESGAYAAVGGLLIGFWHDIKGKELPDFEEIQPGQTQPKRVQSRSNLSERGAFVLACAVLSGFVGTMIGLYYLGFMELESVPNRYARAFIALGSGFLMPKILEYTESLSISKLIKRFIK